MVEFALVGPIVLLLLLILIDFGRGLFYYSQMAAGAREAARQGTLQANATSNQQPSGAYTIPGYQLGVWPQIERLTAFGFPVVSAKASKSGTSDSPPSYGYCDPSCSVLIGGKYGPGHIALSNSAQTDVLYVFVYELDPATGKTQWDAGEVPLRTGGNKLVVVDLKMKWQPTVLHYAGLGPYLVFDAQSAMREEW
jgi:hypothetical protein